MEYDDARMEDVNRRREVEMVVAGPYARGARHDAAIGIVSLCVGRRCSHKPREPLLLFEAQERAHVGVTAAERKREGVITRLCLARDDDLPPSVDSVGNGRDAAPGTLKVRAHRLGRV